MTEPVCLALFVECVGLLEGTWLDPREANAMIASSGGREELLAYLIKDRKALTAFALLTQVDAVWTPKENTLTEDAREPIEAEPLSRVGAEELLKRFAESPSSASVTSDLLHLGTLRDREPPDPLD